MPIKDPLPYGTKLTIGSEVGVIVRYGDHNEYIVQFSDGRRRAIVPPATTKFYEDNGVEVSDLGVPIENEDNADNGVDDLGFDTDPEITSES